MKFERDLPFLQEAARYGLRYACEHCSLWDPEQDRCASGFATAAHRLEGDKHRPLLFCKEFELA